MLHMDMRCAPLARVLCLPNARGSDIGPMDILRDMCWPAGRIRVGG